MSVIARAWHRLPSVTAKFLVILIPAMLVVAFTFSVVFYQYKRETGRALLRDQINAAAAANAEALSSALWALDLGATDSLIRTMSVAEGVTCVRVSDDLLGSVHWWPVPDCLGGPAARAPGGVVRAEIMVGERRLGSLELGYSFETIDAALMADITSNASLTILILAATAATAVFSHRVTIGTPLRRFVTAINMAQRFHARTPVAWESADQMGRVIAAYNQLVTRLAVDEAELSRERHTLRAMLDTVDQGILMVDGDLSIILHNQRAADLLDVPAEFLAGRPLLADLLRLQESRGAFDDCIEDFDLRPGSLRQVLSRSVAFKRRRPDGVVLEIRSNPLTMGGFVRTISDITPEARAAADMVKAMQDLEVAYGELKETQASLLQAEKMASLAMLVAGVAHEINTPVGIAYGCATHLTTRTRELSTAIAGNTLKRSLLTGYVATAEESARLIQQNLGRAADLIQSFKRVAVDQASQERRRFDLAVYIGEIITALRPRLRKSPHQVEVKCPDGIVMDSYPGALSQVITNLVLNALTHAFAEGEGGHVSIVARRIEGGQVAISVADDGRGISSEHIDRVFEPFFTTQRGRGGSGLGLHIVFNLVSQTLGGRIGVESEAGKGTTFTLRVPVLSPARESEDAAASQAEPAEGRFT